MPITPRPPSSLGRDEIARRIPHQGSMCLLEQVTAWDMDRITCEATSHLDANNPLRAHGRLGAACGIEYAAQAMAVHGSLVSKVQAGPPVQVATPGTPKAGYLVSVRGVTLHVPRLDDLGTALTVQAERHSGNAGSILYGFTLHAGATLLVSGRAVVMLDAAGLNPFAVPTKETP